MAGRPHKFKTIEEMQEKIDEYFKWADENKRPYTVTGLAVYLDTSRETIMNYQNYRDDEFFDAIKKAKLKILQYAEESLWRTTQVAGPIFSLKNNYSQYFKEKVYTEDETDYTEQEKKLEELRKKAKDADK